MIIEDWLADEQTRVWFRYYPENRQVVILSRYIKYFPAKLYNLPFDSFYIDTDEELDTKSILSYLGTGDAAKIKTLELANLKVPLADVCEMLKQTKLTNLVHLILDDLTFKYNSPRLKLVKLLTNLPKLTLVECNGQMIVPM